MDQRVDTKLISGQHSSASAERCLRICLLGYRSAPFGGGQGIYLKYLSKALMEAGHQVDVISGQPYPHLVDGVRLIKLPGLNLFENGLLSLRPRHLTSWANIAEWLSKLSGGFAEPYAFGRRLKAYMKQHGHNYDIVHDNQSLCYGLLDVQNTGLPVLATIHHPIQRDVELALGAARNAWHRLLIRRWHHFVRMQERVVRKLRHIITVSECSRQDIVKAFGIPAESIRLIPCGIDTEVFRPMPEVARESRLLLSTVSADQPLKGLHFLLHALKRLREDYADTRLIVVGKPKPGGSTERLIARLALEPAIEFVHNISTEELVGLYARAHLAVVPSLYEGFGLPAGEAMACGTPLVSSDGGALPEVVGDAAALVGKGDSDALYSAIADLFENPARCQELSVLGRRRIEQQFSWRITARQIAAYYQEIISEAEAKPSLDAANAQELGAHANG